MFVFVCVCLCVLLQVVRKHGGDLVVESEQGVGSTFRAWASSRLFCFPGVEGAG